MIPKDGASGGDILRVLPQRQQPKDSGRASAGVVASRNQRSAPELESPQHAGCVDPGVRQRAVEEMVVFFHQGAKQFRKNPLFSPSLRFLDKCR